MKKAFKKSLSLLLVVIMVFSVFNITASAAQYTVKLSGGSRRINGTVVYATFTEELQNLSGDVYVLDGVEYTLDRENISVTFMTDSSGKYYLPAPDKFFLLPGHTTSSDTWTNSPTSTAGSNKIGKQYTVINNNKNYGPKYTTEKYTVSFLPGVDGTGTEVTSTNTYNYKITLPDAIFTRSGFVQIGWATVENSDVVEYNFKERYTITDNVQMYPVWEKIVFDFSDIPESIDFGSICSGCIADAKNEYLWLYNKSNVEIKFTVPELQYFKCSTTSSEIAEGEGFYIEIYPLSTLTAGVYTEQLVLGVNDYATTIEIDLSFTVIDSAEHSFGDWVVTTEPSCTTVGSKCKICSLCGYQKDITEIPAKHNFVDGFCTLCNEQQFFYKTTEQGVIILGMLDPRAELIIPDTIDGMPVVEIAENAFDSCEEITSVVIPEGVTRIGRGAFNMCQNLTSVSIPSTMKSIGMSAFSNTNINTVFIEDMASWCEIEFELYTSNPMFSMALVGMAVGVEVDFVPMTVYVEGEPVTEIVIPDGVTKIKNFAFTACGLGLKNVTIPDSVQSIGVGAFGYCTFLQNLIIGENVKNIGEVAFEACISLPSVVIPDSVEKIGLLAFNACMGLTAITIGERVTRIESEAFSGLKMLESIAVDAENESFSSIDGVLFNKDATQLILYPANKNNSKYIIPDSVRTISDEAFYNAANLVEIEIHDNVESIGKDVFDGTGYYNDESNWVGEVLYIGNHLIDTEYLSVDEYIIKDGTKTIADNASFGNNVKYITVPDTVVNVGEDAFNISSLVAVTVAEDNKSYTSVDGVLFNKDMTNLIRYPSEKSDTEYIIPDSVTSIREDSFWNCASLTSITIPKSVTNIGRNAIWGIPRVNITDIEVWCNIDFNADTIGGGLEFNAYSANLYLNGELVSELIIPEGVTTIPAGAFANMTSIVSVVIPDSVTDIGASAFKNCINLEFVDIPNSVTNMGITVFAGCTSLTSVTIPDSVTSIGNSVFSKCTSLESIDIPNSVTNIGYNAFEHCTSLTSVTIPDSVANIGSSAFEGCTSLASVVIPDSVTRVFESTFEGCTNLTNVIIPDSVKVIEKRVFYNCPNLRSVAIPDSVETFYQSSFDNLLEELTVYCYPYSGALLDAISYNLNYIVVDILKTENSRIDYDNKLIYTPLSCNTNIADVLSISSTSTMETQASFINGETELFGTGSTVKIFENGKYLSEYTIIVDGDTNGDSVCDALDCFDVELASNGNAELDGAYALAGDSNSDNVIDISDYQSIVNKAIAS